MDERLFPKPATFSGHVPRRAAMRRVFHDTDELVVALSAATVPMPVTSAFVIRLTATPRMGDTALPWRGNIAWAQSAYPWTPVCESLWPAVRRR